jgi:hypothetical protein
MALRRFSEKMTRKLKGDDKEGGGEAVQGSILSQFRAPSAPPTHILFLCSIRSMHSHTAVLRWRRGHLSAECHDLVKRLRGVSFAKGAGCWVLGWEREERGGDFQMCCASCGPCMTSPNHVVPSHDIICALLITVIPIAIAIAIAIPLSIPPRSRHVTSPRC